MLFIIFAAFLLALVIVWIGLAVAKALNAPTRVASLLQAREQGDHTVDRSLRRYLLYPELMDAGFGHAVETVYRKGRATRWIIGCLVVVPISLLIFSAGSAQPSGRTDSDVVERWAAQPPSDVEHAFNQAKGRAANEGDISTVIEMGERERSLRYGRLNKALEDAHRKRNEERWRAEARTSELLGVGCILLLLWGLLFTSSFLSSVLHRGKFIRQQTKYVWTRAPVMNLTSTTQGPNLYRIYGRDTDCAERRIALLFASSFADAATLAITSGMTPELGILQGRPLWVPRTVWIPAENMANH